MAALRGNVAFLAVETVLALFTHDRLGIDTPGFGLLLTAEATGGLLGAGIATHLGRRLGTGTVLTCTAAVEGLAILGLAAAPNPYVAGLALAVCGAGMGATMVLAPSLRQGIVPAHPMGRIASTSRLLAMCAAPLGAFLGGRLATTHDVRSPLHAAGGLLLAMTAVTASMTGNRRVEAALRAAAPAGGPENPALKGAPRGRVHPPSCDACRSVTTMSVGLSRSMPGWRRSLPKWGTAALGSAERGQGTVSPLSHRTRHRGPNNTRGRGRGTVQGAGRAPLLLLTAGGGEP